MDTGVAFGAILGFGAAAFGALLGSLLGRAIAERWVGRR